MLRRSPLHRLSRRVHRIALIRSSFSSRPHIGSSRGPTPPSSPPRDHAIPPLPSPSRFRASLPRLGAIASRTGVPLPSLALSFLVLHELTALVPLIAFFFIFQALGAGAGIVAWVASLSNGRKDEEGWRDWRGLVGRWYEEGQKRVERVGRRYLILGYDKASKMEEGGKMLEMRSATAAEKVADAIAAYVVVKVCSEVGIATNVCRRSFP